MLLLKKVSMPQETGVHSGNNSKAVVLCPVWQYESKPVRDVNQQKDYKSGRTVETWTTTSSGTECYELLMCP